MNYYVAFTAVESSRYVWAEGVEKSGGITPIQSEICQSDDSNFHQELFNIPFGQWLIILVSI